MAILGSCALARGNNQSGPLYCLAKSAKIERVNRALNLDTRGTDHLMATSQDKKRSKFASIPVILSKRSRIWSAIIKNTPPRLFDRLFGQHRVNQNPDPSVSPYAVSEPWKILDLCRRTPASPTSAR